jgi:hypothetical protein
MEEGRTNMAMQKLSGQQLAELARRAKGNKEVADQIANALVSGQFEPSVDNAGNVGGMIDGALMTPATSSLKPTSAIDPATGHKGIVDIVGSREGAIALQKRVRFCHGWKEMLRDGIHSYLQPH